MTGNAGGVPTFGPVVRIAFDFAPGEVENGIDDNGNGLRDERGLSFHVAGRELTIRLCWMRPGPDRRPIVRTLQTSQTLRN